MEFHRVGGSVRDMIMGIEPRDIDYVVIGATEDDMLVSGFKKIVTDFPVFLHPETGDEYALARREKKTGNGYLGFTTVFEPGVTLIEDLSRRDITVNSIAMTKNVFGQWEHLNDPFNGKWDIDHKILRHTSNAFTEDPVRVLRLARFKARFGPDWTVAPETKELIHIMAKKGVLSELTPERIWKELSRALMEPYPRLFFDTLLECDALHVLFPEIYKLLTALESHRWHPEGNAFSHSMLVLTQAAKMNLCLEERFFALTHDFGKGLTRFENLPKHYGHENTGVKVIENFCARLKVPAKITERAMKLCRVHMLGHKLDELNPKTIVNMFIEMGVLNDPILINYFYNLVICDERGRLGSENSDVTHLTNILEFYDVFKSVKFASVFPNGETNANKIKDVMFKERVQAIKIMKEQSNVQFT